MKIKILDQFLRDNNETSLNYAYDGDRGLYTLKRLNFDDRIIQFGRTSFNISITYQSVHNLMNAHSDVRSADESSVIMDVILQTAALLSQEKQGRVRFVPRSPTPAQLHDLPGFPGKALWMGHTQTVQSSRVVNLTYPGMGNGPKWGNGSNPYQVGHDVHIGCQISPASVPSIPFQSLSEYLIKVLRYAILGQNRNSPDRQVTRAVRGLQAETHYMPSRVNQNGTEKRTHKIESIDFSKNAKTHTFLVDDRETSLFDYFRTKYNVILEFPHAPLVQVHPKNRQTYLPAELLYISQQRLPGNYSEDLKSCLADSMCMEPEIRKGYIQEKVNELFSNNEILREFGLEVDNNMVRWNAELLQAPELEYKDSSSGRIITFNTDNEKGAWNMRGKAFLEGKELATIIVIDTTGQHRSEDQSPQLRAFMTQLRNQIRNVGMRGTVRVKSDVVRIDQLQQYKKQVIIPNGKVDMIFVLLPRKQVAPYKAVKSTLDDLCPSQCLVVDNTPGLNERKDVNRGAGHVCNILAKVNQKLVGKNHRIRRGWKCGCLPLLWISDSNRTTMLGFMVIGVNISNPQTGMFGNGKYAPSVCSLVASADEDCTIWVHSFRVQRRGNELITALDEMLSDVLLKRSKYLGSDDWPDRIVFIRDGVSEGKMEDVTFQEVDAIKTVYSKAGRNSPDVTVFAAIRNHQTRFWDPKSENSRANLGPGTWIAESGVHLSKYPNFFLLSHAGIKGMSRPVRYFIIQDEVGMRPEIKNTVQNDLMKFWSSFIYQQCYLYQRCQRAVRVPAPIYYADQLAQRGRVLASPIIGQELGIDLISDANSDAASVSSGSSRQPRADITEQLCNTSLNKANEFLKAFTDGVTPMFYC